MGPLQGPKKEDNQIWGPRGVWDLGKGSGGLTSPGAPWPNSLWGPYTSGWNGVSKGIEDGRRPPTL
jgi:hypothetical protein